MNSTNAKTMRTLQEAFERQAEQAPNGIAVSDALSQLTYAELDANSNRLAHRLRQLGAGPECIVGICLPRSIDLIVAMVAVVKTGAAYLPLDSEHPTERLEFYLRDSAARVLVTTSALLIESSADVVLLDRDAPAIAALPATRLAPSAAPGDLAYVIYTSGSTGQPKGTLVTNRNVLRLFTQTSHWFSFDSADVWTMFHSCAFDFSVWEIWGALLYGGRLVIVPFDTSRSPDATARLIREQGVTVLNQTPSAFRQISRSLLNQDGGVHSLRYIVFGGEALEFASLRKWVDRYGADRTQLINMYGITETTVHVTYRRLNVEDVTEGHASLIGEPIPDLGIELIDEHLRPVAVGENGEILVTGEGVARGYLNRPELSASRFIPWNGHMAYRSGDLARRTVSGDIEYLGRIDQQVKVRGFRVELGEIGARLIAHPALADAAVIDFRQDGEVKLAAYCVAESGRKPAPAALRRFLSAQAPSYMIPSVFLFLDALPLTVNGKLNRAALPAPLAEVTDYAAPQSATETELAEIWCDVLQLECAGREDNFIALGGDSLLAAQAIARIAAARDVSLGFRDFFDAATLADLATLVDRAIPVATSASIVAAPRELPLPASTAQQRLWLTSQMSSCDKSYNETLSIAMNGGQADPELLTEALRKLAMRHESLRTTFIYKDRALWQRIQPSAVVSLDVVTGEHEGALAAERAARRPFDLQHGPLWRALLVHGEQCSKLHVTIHHIVWDALSEGVFVADLQRLYRGMALEPLVLQSADVAVWEKQRLASADFAPQIEFWKKTLAGELPILELPGALPRVENPSTFGERVAVSLNPGQTSALAELAAREGATPFQTLAAILQVLLHRYTGAEDIILGSVVNTRTAAMRNIVGYHVAPIAMRVAIESDLSFGTLLARVRNSALDAYSNSALPFERILEEVRPTRHAGVNPLFQASLSLDPPRQSVDGWTWRHYEIFNGSSKFDLSLQLTDEGRTIDGHIEFRPRAVSPDLVRRMAGHLGALVDAVTTNPDIPLSALNILTTAERQELYAWGHPAALPSTTPFVHQMFEEQARRNPSAPAIVCDGQTLTYQQLDTRANQFAHWLQSVDGGRVSHESLVGVCLDRSPEALIALLGVFKAGAAYLPLDPTHPEARLAFMLQDSDACVIVAHRRTAAKASAIHGETPLLIWEETEADRAACPTHRPDSIAGAQSLAYAIYTSGSTGNPKGVLIEHASYANTIAAAGRVFGMSPDRRALQFARFSFDASLFEIGLTLAAGGALVLCPQQTLLSPRDLALTAKRENINWMLLPHSLLSTLDPNDFPAVKSVTSAGEMCSSEVAERWSQTARFFNAYGPTEIAIASSIGETRCGGVDGCPSIGSPLAGVIHWILDRAGQPAPVGVPGELYIGGPGVARGYLNRPELTAERFGANHQTERLYRTGDLVRWRPDGEIDFLGRIDLQVKLRGFRIELGEIESHLRSHPEVLDATVVMRADQTLAAWIVSRNLQPAGVAQTLRAHLSALVPEYMIPSAFGLIHHFPLTSSGKVDRKGLAVKAVSAPAPRNASTKVGPGNPRTAYRTPFERSGARC